MNPTTVNKKVTFPFAHEFEKSYETLIPRASSWLASPRRSSLSHDETLELVLHILLEACDREISNNYFCETFKLHDFVNTLMIYMKYIIVH